MYLSRLPTYLLLIVFIPATVHLSAADTGSAEPVRGPAHSFETPRELADEILRLFSDGSAEEFAAVYPFEDGRNLVEWAVENEVPRVPGFSRVLAEEGDRAVVIISGYVKYGNSGSETVSARGFSEVYEAERSSSGWVLARQMPLDALGSIRRQNIDVQIEPGSSLRVVDTLSVDVEDTFGWASRLNHLAKLECAGVDGREAAARAGGGLVWVDAEPGRRQIVLTYRIDVARDSTAHPNSGRFESDYGHVRNQYFWHPFDWFDKPDSHFRITAHAPAEYVIATDLQQSETVENGVRTVTGHTLERTYALSLFYDRDWVPVDIDAGPFEFKLFATSEFEPSPDSLSTTFMETYESLAGRFGPPKGGAFAVVHSRAREGSGWLFRTNNAMATPVLGGGRTMRAAPYPRNWFGHEVAHGWTTPTGRAANFLREGWATYAESKLLADKYGEEVALNFWEMERNIFETRGYEGVASILDDPHNSGVAYSKGSWIFYMLEYLMGREAFARGLRAYMSIEPGNPAGIKEFTAAMQAETDTDLSTFLRPWLEETVIPDIRTHLRGDSLVLVQHGPVFHLPLDVRVDTRSGSHLLEVNLTNRQTAVDISGLGSVEAVYVDPDHRMLIERYRGDQVTFSRPAGDESAVLLASDFTTDRLPARRDGDDWVVDVLLSEGRYHFNWIIDDERQDAEVVVVEPVREFTDDIVSEVYPR